MRATRAAVALLLVGALAGCDGDGGNRRSTGTTTTSLASTTTAPPATTTSVASAPVPTAPITIPSKNDGVSAEGSGCAPPAGDTLPDGIWFGDLKSVDVGAGTVSLDLNCFFVGEAANNAAAADGSTDLPVPNDYWIRNKVHKIYVLPTVPDVAAFELGAGGADPNLVAAGNGPAAVAAMLAELADHWIGWLQVSGGKVIAVQQQFVP